MTEEIKQIIRCIENNAKSLENLLNRVEKLEKTLERLSKKGAFK